MAACLQFSLHVFVRPSYLSFVVFDLKTLDSAQAFHLSSRQHADSDTVSAAEETWGRFRRLMWTPWPDVSPACCQLGIWPSGQRWHVYATGVRGQRFPVSVFIWSHCFCSSLLAPTVLCISVTLIEARRRSRGQSPTADQPALVSDWTQNQHDKMTQPCRPNKLHLQKMVSPTNDGG